MARILIVEDNALNVKLFCDLLAALVRFLEAHEPDLVAVAAVVGVGPEALVEARRALEREVE